MTSSIETHTGRFYDYGWPLPEQIVLEDIAHALSKTCRFGGHCSQFYSVAEHALNVRMLVIEHGRPDLGLAALHHDSHEAYLGDIPSPLKTKLGDAYRMLASDADVVIAEWLGLHPMEFRRPAVKDADALALRHEAAVLKSSRGAGEHWGYDHPAKRTDFVKGLQPDRAAALFMQAHHIETGTIR